MRPLLLWDQQLKTTDGSDINNFTPIPLYSIFNGKTGSQIRNLYISLFSCFSQQPFLTPSSTQRLATIQDLIQTISHVKYRLDHLCLNNCFLLKNPSLLLITLSATDHMLILIILNCCIVDSQYEQVFVHSLLNKVITPWGQRPFLLGTSTEFSSVNIWWLNNWSIQQTFTKELPCEMN